jgi:HD-GYP domain-containing protein (c-di-GMP phosphodiesterase class II)
MNRRDFAEIMRTAMDSAKADESLKSAINIDELLKAVENKKNSHLDNKTLADISREKYEQLVRLFDGVDDKSVIQTLFTKLHEYRYIDEVCEIHRGKHVRWIRATDPKKLTAGGIVVDIKFLDTGTHILVKNPLNRFIQYKLDDCITFQKMSDDEMLILAAYDSIT